jgi:hypothetical protein
MLIVVGICAIIDSIIDSIISPRIMADSLSVHPAAVMVAVLMSASLLGFIGVLLAAPVLASLVLIIKFVVYKLMDQDPWDHIQLRHPPEPIGNIPKRFWTSIKTLMNRFRRKSKVENSTELNQRRRKNGKGKRDQPADNRRN